MLKQIIGIILMLVGFGLVLYAGITQQMLCVAKFGVAFQKVVIPDISLIGYTGIIPMVIGYIMVLS